MKNECYLALANKTIQIRCLFPYVQEYCKQYQTEKKIPDFTIDIGIDDIAYKRIKSEDEDRKEGIAIRHFTDEYLETLMVNDDKPLLKITEAGVTVFGTPWDGKHRLSNNIAVPLKAICVLNRDETNHIEKVSGKDIYPLLLQQTYRSKDPMKVVQTLKLIDRMIQNTKLYALGCNMNPEAAVVAYEGMQETKK